MKRTLFVASMFAIMGAASAQEVFIGPQIRVDPGRGTAAANETTMAASGLTAAEIGGGWNDWSAGSQQNEIIRNGVALSSDGGATWSDFLLRPPGANQGSVEGDPITIYDHRTGTVWVGGISFTGNGGVFVAKKNQGANTVGPSIMTRVAGNADKVWGGAGIAPNDPNSTRLYVAYNLGSQFSADMGQTWSNPVALGSGIGFLPRVGPNGEVYVSYWDFNLRHYLRRSFDGGLTYSAPIVIANRLDTWSIGDETRIPGTFRVPPMNTLAVDPVNGTLYAIYFDTTNIVNGNRNLDLYFTKSTDKGTTWSTPKVINGDSNPPGDQFFPWLEVDRTGRLNLSFWDSRNTVQNDNAVNGFYDIYYSFSDDGGATWSENRLTPNSFNSNNDGLARSQQFLGDYNGLGYSGSRSYPLYISTQNGDPDDFTHVIINPYVVPDSFTVTKGTFVSGTANDLARSDDLRVVIQSRAQPTPSAPQAEIQISAYAGSSTASAMTARFELSSTGFPSSNMLQEIDLLNTTNGQFEAVDMRQPSTGDQVITLNVSGDPNRFLSSGRQIVARISWFDQGTATPNWLARVDEVRYKIIP